MLWVSSLISGEKKWKEEAGKPTSFLWKPAGKKGKGGRPSKHGEGVQEERSTTSLLSPGIREPREKGYVRRSPNIRPGKKKANEVCKGDVLLGGGAYLHLING